MPSQARSIFRPAWPALAGALTGTLFCGATLAATPTATVWEFFNAKSGHYFMTADPREAAAIDFPGSAWTRTGGVFMAWKSAGDAPALQPVCRFNGQFLNGNNTHLFSVGASDCQSLAASANWSYEGTAFYIRAAADPAGKDCPADTTPVFRTYNNGDAKPVNDANNRFTIDYSAYRALVDQGHRGDGAVMCSPLSEAQKDADAARLLEQASFGVSEASLAGVRAKGIAAWLEEQLNAPPSRYPEYPDYPVSRPESCVDACARDNYSLFPLQLAFFQQSLGGEDQLRQRVAFALSQVLVVSALKINQPTGMAPYQQILRDLAFGNYEDILMQVTLNPAMGRYLDMVNNQKPAGSVRPNENYAREILQLFSIGLNQLKPDGSLRLDARGKTIPTYGQEEIEGFAYTFTGWTFPTRPGAQPKPRNPLYYAGQMLAVPANHAAGEKLLLDGTKNPAGQSMGQDLKNAIHVIFSHPNVGPFIGKQLIQKLVTGNPSGAYVARVAAAFDDNGQGVRGDMKAVVRAVLLDPEARGPLKLDPQFGKLREPVLQLTNLVRGFNGASDGVPLRLYSTGMSQGIYAAPTVFNYYPPDYLLPGGSVLAPEFAIHNSANSFNRSNATYDLIYRTKFAPDATVSGATGTALDFSAWQPFAGNPDALLDRLDRLLLHGTMSAAMRDTLKTAIGAVPASDTLGRVRMAAYLIAGSAAYQVQR